MYFVSAADLCLGTFAEFVIICAPWTCFVPALCGICVEISFEIGTHPPYKVVRGAIALRDYSFCCCSRTWNVRRDSSNLRAVHRVDQMPARVAPARNKHGNVSICMCMLSSFV